MSLKSFVGTDLENSDHNPVCHDSLYGQASCDSGSELLRKERWFLRSKSGFFGIMSRARIERLVLGVTEAFGGLGH
jgi:hypothetical protein